MTTFLLTIHIIICLFLILIVLVQSGKGAQMGVTFGGGSSQTLFGSRGASTFLNKLTTATAVVFMLTSLTLAIIASRPITVIEDIAPTDRRGVVIPQQIPQQPLEIPQQPLSE